MDKKEVSYLKDTIAAIKALTSFKQAQLQKNTKLLEKDKQYIFDNYYELEKGENLARYYSELNQIDESVIEEVREIKNLQRQESSPYFARIDFAADGQQAEPIYIGLGTVLHDKMYVHDWRAPISSLYYDFGVGRAFYYVDKKATAGEISLKRQYKIENGVLKSYFDTNLTINDDILREILGRNSSAQMKQIVSTIQKEQNQIIRTEEYDNFLVQGVAGSGKTSIALHRASYLLYRHRKQIKSSDILVMSPNNVFSSYISQVLPELGEDNLVETTFAHIASVELKKPMQPREEMLDALAENPTQELLNEISYKSSFEYLDALLKFLRDDIAQIFSPKTLTFTVSVDDDGNPKDQFIFPEEQTRKLFFETFKGETIKERINKIAWQYAMVFTNARHYNKEQNRGLKERFVKLLYNFMPINDIDKIFEVFLLREGLKPNKSEVVKYMDKGAMLLIKYFLFGFDHDFSAKYLIIDEVQDFSPVDLYVFKKLWPCQSILLGDTNQCIEKCLPEGYNEAIAQMWDAKLINLHKTYRSTRQIAEFANGIQGIKDVEYVNRDGEEPKLIKCAEENIAQEIENILKECEQYAHIAIICKCKKEAKKLEKLLKGKVKYTFIAQPEDYNNKVLLTTCATAKGIEFDAVIIPYADQTNYNNNLDKNIIYVSSTRALHRLYFISTGAPTKFIKTLE